MNRWTDHWYMTKGVEIGVKLYLLTKNILPSSTSDSTILNNRCNTTLNRSHKSHLTWPILTFSLQFQQCTRSSRRWYTGTTTSKVYTMKFLTRSSCSVFFIQNRFMYNNVTREQGQYRARSISTLNNIVMVYLY